MAKRKISVVSRKALEEESGQPILDRAKREKVAFLVPGDPLIATTHVDLRIRAEKQGIKTRIVHGASIISAVIGLSGLQNYKYGRSVTVPFARQGFTPETPYEVITENKKTGLHTLCFLDIDAEEEKYMTIQEALQTLRTLEERRKENVVNVDTLVVGLARAGSQNPTVKADYAQTLLKFDFGPAPHALVFPGELHFMEAEALVILAKGPPEIRQMAQ
jgi:diphthine synthase